MFVTERMACSDIKEIISTEFLFRTRRDSHIFNTMFFSYINVRIFNQQEWNMKQDSNISIFSNGNFSQLKYLNIVEIKGCVITCVW